MTFSINAQTVCLIDDDDYDLVSQYSWHISSTGYAVWRGIKDGKKQTIRMHRLINKTPPDKHTDHINHNRLDNRRSNLRSVTVSENMRNKTDQGRGYNWHKQNGSWNVETMGRRIGGITTEEEAQRIVALLRSGGDYIKPERTHCKRGHSLYDAYIVSGNRVCRLCQAIRSKTYYRRKNGGK